MFLFCLVQYSIGWSHAIINPEHGERLNGWFILARSHPEQLWAHIHIRDSNPTWIGISWSAVTANWDLRTSIRSWELCQRYSDTHEMQKTTHQGLFSSLDFIKSLQGEWFVHKATHRTATVSYKNNSNPVNCQLNRTIAVHPILDKWLDVRKLFIMRQRPAHHSAEHWIKFVVKLPA